MRRIVTTGERSGWQAPGLRATLRKGAGLRMTDSKLFELITNGENSGVAFARDGVHPEDLARDVSAFANFWGGRIIIGVEDDGQIAGIQRLGLEDWMMSAVFERCVHPTIQPFYEEVQVADGNRVAVVTISQGVAKPYVARRGGREDAYIRMGSVSRVASGEDLARLNALGGVSQAELLPVSGTSVCDLSLERLADYLSAIVEDRALPASDEEWVERLCCLGFMDEAQDEAPAPCTVAGLVLFGYTPRRFLRHAGVRWIAIDRYDKTHGALDDRVIDRPLVALRKRYASGNSFVAEQGLIESLVDAMTPFVSEEAATVDASMRRERRWLYPAAALREAIVNALAHRDWTRNEEVEVARYADRLEVLSPGALPAEMTVNTMAAGRVRHGIRSLRTPCATTVTPTREAWAFAMGRFRYCGRSETEADQIATDDHLRAEMYSPTEDAATDRSPS